jgi:hypothetical protein
VIVVGLNIHFVVKGSLLAVTGKYVPVTWHFTFTVACPLSFKLTAAEFPHAPPPFEEKYKFVEYAVTVTLLFAGGEAGYAFVPSQYFEYRVINPVLSPVTDDAPIDLDAAIAIGAGENASLFAVPDAPDIVMVVPSIPRSVFALITQ